MLLTKPFMQSNYRRSGFLKRMLWRWRTSCNTALKFLLILSPDRANCHATTLFFARCASTCRKDATISSISIFLDGLTPPCMWSMSQSFLNALLSIHTLFMDTVSSIQTIWFIFTSLTFALSNIWSPQPPILQTLLFLSLLHTCALTSSTSSTFDIINLIDVATQLKFSFYDSLVVEPSLQSYTRNKNLTFKKITNYWNNCY